MPVSDLVRRDTGGRSRADLRRQCHRHACRSAPRTCVLHGTPTQYQRPSDLPKCALGALACCYLTALPFGQHEPVSHHRKAHHTMSRRRTTGLIPNTEPNALTWRETFSAPFRRFDPIPTPTEPNWLDWVRPTSRADKDAFVLVCVARMASGASREQIMDLLGWDLDRLAQAARIGKTMIRQME